MVRFWVEVDGVRVRVRVGVRVRARVRVKGQALRVKCQEVRVNP
jgi:hypothetical protein